MRKESAVVYFVVLGKYLFGGIEEDKEKFNHFSCYLSRSYTSLLLSELARYSKYTVF
jgi:hypothetical protein